MKATPHELTAGPKSEGSRKTGEKGTRATGSDKGPQTQWRGAHCASASGERISGQDHADEARSLIVGPLLDERTFRVIG